MQFFKLEKSSEGIQTLWIPSKKCAKKGGEKVQKGAGYWGDVNCT